MPPHSAGKVVSPCKQTALFCQVLYRGLQEPPLDLISSQRDGREHRRGEECMHGFCRGDFGSGVVVAKQKSRHI